MFDIVSQERPAISPHTVSLRKTERETDRERDRHRETDRETDRERQTDRQTEREREAPGQGMPAPQYLIHPSIGATKLCLL